MVEFGGWEMPVQYTSILKEHAAVRCEAGLFDISHMGEIRVEGAEAVRFLNDTLTNNIEKLAVGGAQYSLLLNDQGGVVDDLFVYRITFDEFFLVVNASHIEEDFAALHFLSRNRAEVSNESSETGALALQGPKSSAVLDAWIPLSSSRLGHHEMKRFPSDICPVWIARTGYTGEEGFEVFFPASFSVEIWKRVLELGKPLGLVPCGLGARDTLRTEVCYPLNGHELASDITPLEAGLGFFVDLQKSIFIGRDALLKQKESGLARKSVALLADPGGPPFRSGYPVLREGKPIGVLTSGILSPTLQRSIGLALIETSHSTLGNSVDIEVRGKYVPAEIVKKPFYKRQP
jgi:aminomethyltransferase